MNNKERPKRNAPKPERYKNAISSDNDRPVKKRQRLVSLPKQNESDYDAMLRRLEAQQNEPEEKFPTCSLPPLNEARSAEQCQNGQIDLVLQNQGHMMQGVDQVVEHVIKLKEQMNDLQNRNAEDKQVQAQLPRNQATLSDDLEGQLRGPMAVERGVQVERPQFLPLRSVEEVESFAVGPAEDFNSVVRYFARWGGSTLRDAVSTCFKQALTDSTAASYAWLGAYETRPLHNTRIMRAIYDATARSRSFPPPTEKEFAMKARLALKAAKQRNRMAARASSAAATTTVGPPP